MKVAVVVQVYFPCETGRPKKECNKWLTVNRQITAVYLQILLEFGVDGLITDFAKLTPF